MQRTPLLGAGRLRIAAVVLGITTVIAIAATTRHHFQMMEKGNPPSYLTWPHAMFQEMPYFYLWALAVPLVVWFVRRVERRELPRATLLLTHFGFAVGVILVEGLLTGWIYGMSAKDFFMQVPTQLVTYAAVLATVLAYEYYRRLMDRELSSAALATELAEARLSALRAQLHPHFVFNALNSVAMLVRGQRNTEAVETIAGLSDLLRDALDDGEQPETSLAEELAFVQRYLAIETVRFGDRLRTTIDVPSELGDARVPRLLLQPLVENAMRHGLGRRAAAGWIEIRAARRGNQLTISVQDDGPGPGAADAAHGHGVGLSNTRQRLATLYGEAAGVTLAPAPGGGALVTVTLPLVLGATA